MTPYSLGVLGVLHPVLAAPLQLVPHFLGVVVLVHIVETALAVCDPAAETAEVILVPLAFRFLFPLYAVTHAHQDAGRLVQVDADGHQVIALRHGQRFTHSQAVDFRMGKVELVGYDLQVAPDDGRGYGEDLLRAGINLVECLHGIVTVSQHRCDDGLSLQETLFLFFVETPPAGFLPARDKTARRLCRPHAAPMKSVSGMDGVAFRIVHTNGQNG